MNQEMESLKADILQCTKCEFAKTRNHVIFGEAPGRE